MVFVIAIVFLRRGPGPRGMSTIRLAHPSDWFGGVVPPAPLGPAAGLADHDAHAQRPGGGTEGGGR